MRRLFNIIHSHTNNNRIQNEGTRSTYDYGYVNMPQKRNAKCTRAL